MTELAGSAALAGNPEGAAPAGEATPAASGAPPAANSNEAPWYGDDNYKGLVETKGWKAPKDVLDSYANLEKLVGSEKLAAPKNDEDVASYERIWNRLGRPQTAEEYKLAAEGIDPTIVKTYAETAHKFGLTQKQADGLIGFYKGLETQAVTAANENFVKSSEQEMLALQNEQGAAFDQFKTDAKRGVREFGLNPDQLESLERAVGTKTMMKMLANQGKYLREDSSDGESSASFGLSPDAAKRQMADLRMNKDFMAAYMDSSHAGHKDALVKMETLAKFSVGKS